MSPACLRGDTGIDELSFDPFGIQTGGQDVVAFLRLDGPLIGVLLRPPQDPLVVRGDHCVTQTAQQDRALGPQVHDLAVGCLGQAA